LKPKLITIQREEEQSAVRSFTFPQHVGQQGANMIHILVHDKKDTVGVVVIEGIKAGQELTGWDAG
jgi:hypothetical protein